MRHTTWTLGVFRVLNENLNQNVKNLILRVLSLNQQPQGLTSPIFHRISPMCVRGGRGGGGEVFGVEGSYDCGCMSVNVHRNPNELTIACTDI
jgi:hypothetical protein